MRYAALALGALVAGASASGHHGHHRRHHLHARNPLGTAVPSCEAKCTTYVTSYLVDVEPATSAPPQSTLTVVPVASETPLPPVEEFTTSTSTSTAYATVTVSTEPVPTPEVTTIAEPGTYTIPAKTVTLTETTAVCVPETTSLPAGTVTYGGVTTVVTTATTFVCPVPTAITKDGTVTYTLTSTEYACPTPGTYVIGGTTTNNAGPTTVEVPVVTVYEPGTYTRPATTVTATRTNIVVTCPLETVTATVVPVGPDAPVETVVKSEPASSAPAPAPTSTKASSAAPSSTKAPSTPTGTFQKPEGLWAITYSPYNDDQSCKTASQVDGDVAAIAAKGFKALRLYSSDCGGLQSVGSACEKYGLKIVLGIFIKAGGVQTADSQVTDIVTWAKWGLVQLFVIGNESVFNGFCTGAELGSYMASVTQKVRAAGYKGPITTTEPVNILKEVASHVCQYMDVVGVNVHPFFNPNVSPSDAGKFVKNEIALAKSYCGNTKDVVVLETGWPNAGEANGAAVPGKEQQKQAIHSIDEENKGTSITWFTWTNDGWKNPGAFGVERQFGCGDIF